MTDLLVFASVALAITVQTPSTKQIRNNGTYRRIARGCIGAGTAHVQCKPPLKPPLSMNSSELADYPVKAGRRSNAGSSP